MVLAGLGMARGDSRRLLVQGSGQLVQIDGNEAVRKARGWSKTREGRGLVRLLVGGLCKGCADKLVAVEDAGENLRGGNDVLQQPRSQ